MMSTTIDELDRPSSVGKALALLASFTQDRPEMGLSEIARRSGVPKSTAHRLLGSLVRAALVTRNGTDYAPGGRLLDLAALTAPERDHLRDVALPYLLDLYEATHESVHLAVLSGHDVVLVEGIRGHGAAAPTARAGVRLAAARSALGRAMLACADPGADVPHADLVRNHGIAFDREATAPGIGCVAAPIRGRHGIVGAVSVSGPTTRFHPPTWAGVLRTVTRAIEAALPG